MKSKTMELVSRNDVLIVVNLDDSDDDIYLKEDSYGDWSFSDSITDAHPFTSYDEIEFRIPEITNQATVKHCVIFNAVYAVKKSHSLIEYSVDIDYTSGESIAHYLPVA